MVSRDSPSPRRVLLVTGLSGAGRTTALHGLEDFGFEAIDNLPLSFLRRLFDLPESFTRPLAVGIDVRTRDFNVENVLEEIESLSTHKDLDLQLIFLDCDDEVLVRRYEETRRRHPAGGERPVLDGIAYERQLLAPIRERANFVFNTTKLSPWEFRQLLKEAFAGEEAAETLLFITSFAYANGLPREADLVFDVRFLNNPHYVAALRPLNGRDKEVGEYVSADPGFDSFFDSLTQMLGLLLPRFEEEGKSYLTIAIGCTGGRHRSVFIAEKLRDWLAEQGRRVSLRHRDLGGPSEGS
ncbi:MAG: RNase adapter RapZ [Alphaproteobacteria bacterium]|nr:RNase adapter RapZ [Alphaproteobacteria bacterium]